jgi:hypothetical protein
MPEPAPSLTPWATHASAQWELMRNAGMLIDFPDRNVSYAMFCFNKADVPRYAAELRKAVDLQSPGEEPPHLEIRAGD